MGIFYERVKIRNLAPVELQVQFDGQRKRIPLGVSELEEVCLPYAMNQNPIRGTQDPNNPHVSGCKYLVVQVGSEYDREPLTKDEWEEHLARPMRMDEKALFAEKYAGDPKARMVVSGVKGKASAKSRYEAGTSPQGLSSFSGKE